MNEFEWRRQMRDLRQPVTPHRDLWASIDAALDGVPPAMPRAPSEAAGRAKNRRRWLIAASFAASVLLAGAIGWHARYLAAPIPATVAQASVPPTAQNWKPADPRLAGAATELNAARRELQQAMQQAPDSPALQRLLMRTERQQNQLRQLANEAG